MQSNSPMYSKKIVYLLSLFIFLVSFLYYPKFQKTGSEATISWDVSGYYWYLPAIFIYKDVKIMSFSDTIMAKYSPSSSAYQYFKHRSGHNIMKYTCGQALQYLPFFLLAHVSAPLLGYEADGFSIPYQFAIQCGSLLMCFIGLWYLRLILLRFFSDKTTAISLITLVLATNYLNFTAIDGAMSHNWLFTWYCLLIHASIQYYENPRLKIALWIGFIVGLCGLTRPTELIAVIIPIFWGMKGISINDIKERIEFLWQQKMQLIAAAGLGFIMLFLQLAYYRYAGQEWLIYAYQDQGFSWLSPYFKDYLFSFRSGWLIYTPIMIFSYLGIIGMVRNKFPSWLAVSFYALVTTYVVLSWDIWWYGGRAMVQSYPILFLGMAFLIQQIIENKNKLSQAIKALSAVCLGLCIYYNIWWTHQTHLGGLVDAYNMSGRYLARVIGRWSIPEDVLKLYDTDKIYEGTRKNVKQIYSNDFQSDTVLVKADKKYGGSIAEFINAERQFTSHYEIPIAHGQADWLRIISNYWCEKKEWEAWRMSQLIVQFLNEEQVVQTTNFRVYRFLNDNLARAIYFDVALPKNYFTKAKLFWWNADGTKELIIDDLVVEQFDEN